MHFWLIHCQYLNFFSCHMEVFSLENLSELLCSMWNTINQYSIKLINEEILAIGFFKFVFLNTWTKSRPFIHSGIFLLTIYIFPNSSKMALASGHWIRKEVIGDPPSPRYVIMVITYLACQSPSNSMFSVLLLQYNSALMWVGFSSCCCT